MEAKNDRVSNEKFNYEVICFSIGPIFELLDGLKIHVSRSQSLSNPSWKRFGHSAEAQHQIKNLMMEMTQSRQGGIH